ncbi:hypothetical protein N9A28_05925 [Sulfurimonas sp.]|nr:hypothetical protein [Sulfurimonas sp.]
MNQDLSTKIKLLIKSEKALLDLEIRKKSKQAVWIAVGILSAFIALVMLNATMFLYLSNNFTTVTSAAILTMINLGFTALAFYIASTQGQDSESESIKDIRDYAWTQLANDIDETKENINEFKDSILQAKENIFGLKNLLPIITSIISLSKKGKNDAV